MENNAKKTKFRFFASVVDTESDEIIARLRAKTIKNLKRQIKRYFAEEGSDWYDNTDGDVLYIKDVEYETLEGRKRIAEISSEVYIDMDVFPERGLDYDIWHDYYLTPNERRYFNIVKVH